MFRITDTVKHLIIINTLMFFGTMVILGERAPYPREFWDWGRLTLALFFPTSEYFSPVQIVTHMFMHGDLFHLFFNMFAIYMFGSAMESLWGPKKFLIYYLFTGFGAMLLYLLVQYLGVVMTGTELLSIENTPMLGASGAVFGLLAAYGMKFPDNVIQLIFPPIALKAKYFVMIYGAIELYLGISGANTGIAHFAHLGGALFGVLLIIYWKKTGNSL